MFYPSFSCNNVYKVSKILDFQLAEAKNLAPPIFQTFGISNRETFFHQSYITHGAKHKIQEIYIFNLISNCIV